MNTPRSLLLSVALLLIVALPPLATHAQGFQTELSHFLSESAGIARDVPHGDLLSAFVQYYGELEGVDFPTPTGYFQYPDRATLSHDTYALHVYPFKLPGAPPHLFLHLRVWSEDLPSSGWFLILAWDDAGQILTPIPVHQEIPPDEFVEIEPVQLDETTSGIAVGGYSGPTGDVGNFTVLAYDPVRGYQTVWIIDAPGHQFTVIHEAKPMALSHLERAQWDASFPVTELSSLGEAELDAHMRQFTVAYVWDEQARTFIETERSEVMHDFAVVNHFLKALLAGDKTALVFVAEGTELFDLLNQEEADFAATMPRLSGEDVRIVPISPYTPSLADILGINVESGRWVALAALSPEASGDAPDGDLWSTNIEHTVALAFFEMQPGEPPQVARVHYYEPQSVPHELALDLEHDPRPTLNFDRLAIRAWAHQHGWHEAYARVMHVKSAENVSDWIRVSAVLVSPLVRWVEFHYRSDLNLEPPSRAEELYDSTVGLDVTPFLLQLTSANLAAIQPENLRVVLSDDRGNRWEGSITPGPTDVYTVFGVSIYDRALWLEFEGLQSEEGWAEINGLTLHVIRQDRLARADLTWNFSPQTDE